MGCEGLALRLIELIYDAAVDPAGWALALEELSKALGDPAIHLSLRLRSRFVEPSVASSSEPGPIYRIHLEEPYHEVFLRLSDEDFPWAAIDRGAVMQRFVRSSDIVEADLAKSRFYGDFMQPQGLALEPPLCHVIALTKVEIELTPDEARSSIEIEARADAVDRTGVEMEALTAVSVAALTIYDMLKAKDRAMVIEAIALHEKHGGKSGDYVRV